MQVVPGAKSRGAAFLLYSENIGAYSNASATHFNGFEPAQVVHVNE